MNCPSCSDSNYYFGLMGHNCPNLSCSLPGDKKPEVEAKESARFRTFYHLKLMELETLDVEVSRGSVGVDLTVHHTRFLTTEELLHSCTYDDQLNRNFVVRWHLPSLGYTVSRIIITDLQSRSQCTLFFDRKQPLEIDFSEDPIPRQVIC